MAFWQEFPPFVLLISPQTDWVKRWLAPAGAQLTVVGDWPADLTFAENLELAAGLYGGVSRGRRAEFLAMGQGLELDPARRLGQLSPFHARLASLLLAFLHRPELVLVFELTAGLTVPAGQALWSRLVQLWRQEGSRLVYVTADVGLAGRLPAGELWLANGDGVGQRWPFDQLPPLWRSPRHYRFEFQTGQGAESFMAKLEQDPAGTFCRRLAPCQVQIISDNTTSLVDLTLMAGLSLARFETRPVTLADLPLAVEGEKMSLPKAIAAKQLVSGRERWAAMAQIARYQWRWHFRQLWGLGNMILSAPLNLIFLLPIIQLGRLHGAMVVCAAAMSLVWACPAGQPYFAQVVPFWRQLYRGPAADLGLGYGLGQLMLALVHNGLFWLGFGLLWPNQLALAGLWWLVAVGLALLLAVAVGRVVGVGGSGRAFGLGFGLFLLIVWLIVRM